MMIVAFTVENEKTADEMLKEYAVIEVMNRGLNHITGEVDLMVKIEDEKFEKLRTDERVRYLDILKVEKSGV